MAYFPVGGCGCRRVNGVAWAGAERGYAAERMYEDACVFCAGCHGGMVRGIGSFCGGGVMWRRETRVGWRWNA